MVASTLHRPASSVALPSRPVVLDASPPLIQAKRKRDYVERTVYEDGKQRQIIFVNDDALDSSFLQPQLLRPPSLASHQSPYHQLQSHQLSYQQMLLARPLPNRLDESYFLYPHQQLTLHLQHQQQQQQDQFLKRRRKESKNVCLQTSYDDKDGHYILLPRNDLSSRFTIIRQLGQGTFGKVAECFDHLTGSKVAVKVVRAIPKYRDASMGEMRILNTLCNADPLGQFRCINLLHYFEHRNHVCMVFPLLGPSLFDFMKENHFQPFTLEQVQEFAVQLLESVTFLHTHNVIHTDLKPENILLTVMGTAADNIQVRSPLANHICVSRRHMPKVYATQRQLQSLEICLIDFGSATIEEEYHSLVVSTRHYRAPEIILEAGWSYPCDIWSIGCILIELITGEALFQTHDNIEHLVMMEAVLGPIPEALVKRSSKNVAKFFRNNGKLAWPQPDTKRDAKTFVRSLKPLKEITRAAAAATPLHSSFYDLVSQLLTFDPTRRITAREALAHPFFANIVLPSERGVVSNTTTPAALLASSSSHGTLAALPTILQLPSSSLGAVAAHTHHLLNSHHDVATSSHTDTLLNTINVTDRHLAENNTQVLQSRSSISTAPTPLPMSQHAPTSRLHKTTLTYALTSQNHLLHPHPQHLSVSLQGSPAISIDSGYSHNLTTLAFSAHPSDSNAYSQVSDHTIPLSLAPSQSLPILFVPQQTSNSSMTIAPMSNNNDHTCTLPLTNTTSNGQALYISPPTTADFDMTNMFSGSSDHQYYRPRLRQYQQDSSFGLHENSKSHLPSTSSVVPSFQQHTSHLLQPPSTPNSLTGSAEHLLPPVLDSTSQLLTYHYHHYHHYLQPSSTATVVCSTTSHDPIQHNALPAFPTTIPPSLASTTMAFTHTYASTDVPQTSSHARCSPLRAYHHTMASTDVMDGVSILSSLPATPVVASRDTFGEWNDPSQYHHHHHPLPPMPLSATSIFTHSYYHQPLPLSLPPPRRHYWQQQQQQADTPHYMYHPSPFSQTNGATATVMIDGHRGESITLRTSPFSPPQWSAFLPLSQASPIISAPLTHKYQVSPSPALQPQTRSSIQAYPHQHPIHTIISAPTIGYHATLNYSHQYPYRQAPACHNSQLIQQPQESLQPYYQCLHHRQYAPLAIP